ncbi:hypothetical protein ABT369_38665 [Dactylosporangium sp. NPDC000244]|uniref:hypothetical protein n=1 Tax=Dactylosporangium sp. NPDC000244 TaxID=3154365 RepID=UPI0033229660
MPEPRMVRCQYGQTPHPLDDECVNVADDATGGWLSGSCTDPDDAMEAALRHAAAVIDGCPPKPVVHPSHQPEEPGAELLPGHTTCKVCCRFVAHHGCASPRGVAPCAGPGRVELREPA